MTGSNVTYSADPSDGLLDVHGVASLLNCSARHVYRLVDAGKVPSPLRLGSLIRFSRSSIVEWIDGGCKPVRARKKH